MGAGSLETAWYDKRTMSAPAVFQPGYILNPRADAVWFIGLPFVAVAFAFGAQAWLPFAALGALHLWVTVPHHYVTWIRTYGHQPDWERFKERLTFGPLVIAAIAGLSFFTAPLTLLVVILVWDVQHGLMQQHGFGRIYDFKAKTGAPSTRRFDLALHAVLYINMYLASPLFTQTVWVPTLYSWGFTVSPAQLAMVQTVSWTVTAAMGLAYLGHLAWCLANGHKLNPLKFAFIAGSYFLWYFTAWQTNSILVWGIAHRLMHGLQYIVMVHSYMRRQGDSGGIQPAFTAKLFQSGHLHWFIGSALLYAFAYQVLVASPISDFAFGYVETFRLSAFIDEIPMLTQIRVVLIAEIFQLVHFYVDSFIWKVSDKRVQQTL